MKSLFFHSLFLSLSLSLSAQVAPPVSGNVGQTDTILGEITPDGDDGEEILTPAADKNPPINWQIDTTIWTFAEEMPTFPGGDSLLKKYIQDSLRVPASELNAGKYGTAYVRFVVEKDGSISNVTLAKAIPSCPLMNAEALRVIADSPKWIPGTMRNYPVRVHMVMPVRFYSQ